jgi:hypothetical protein
LVHAYYYGLIDCHPEWIKEKKTRNRCKNEKHKIEHDRPYPRQKKSSTPDSELCAFGGSGSVVAVCKRYSENKKPINLYINHKSKYKKK